MSSAQYVKGFCYILFNTNILSEFVLLQQDNSVRIVPEEFVPILERMKYCIARACRQYKVGLGNSLV